MTTTPNRLIKLIQTPSKIKNELDWKKARCVATLDIGHSRIGIAVGSHPEYGEPLQIYEPLKLQLVTTNSNKEGQRQMLDKSAVKKLETVILENNICGILCLWPLERSSGRAGYACGKVLYTLEQLAQQSKTIMSPSRPIGLWATDYDRSCAEDEWGRSPLYSKTTNKTIHSASKNQYFHHEGSSEIAAQIYKSFCQRYWPELWEENYGCYRDDGKYENQVRRHNWNQHQQLENDDGPVKQLSDFTLRYSSQRDHTLFLSAAAAALTWSSISVLFQLLLLL